MMMTLGGLAACAAIGSAKWLDDQERIERAKTLGDGKRERKNENRGGIYTCARLA
jgi:hypothetical protein